jgi:hypothetical protein
VANDNLKRWKKKTGREERVIGIRKGTAIANIHITVELSN